MGEPKWLIEVKQLISSSVCSQPSSTTSSPALFLCHQWWPAHGLQLHNKTWHLVFEFSFGNSERSSNVKIFAAVLIIHCCATHPLPNPVRQQPFCFLPWFCGRAGVSQAVLLHTMSAGAAVMGGLTWADGVQCGSLTLWASWWGQLLTRPLFSM